MKILEIILCITLLLPLAAFLLFLFEKCLFSIGNKELNLFKKCCICTSIIFGIVLTAFLLVALILGFVFGITFPKPISTIAAICLLIYYVLSMTILGGIGYATGHMGLSPTRTIKSIIELLKR